MTRARHAALAALLLMLSASAARADITGFIGPNFTPSTRLAKGAAVGVNLLFLGFEFEYSQTNDDPSSGSPSLTTAMGNFLLQSPIPILGLQPYFTTGGGVFREELGSSRETDFGLNTGGGVKLGLLGPIGLRFDYRAFILKGRALHTPVHRLYAGVNLKF